MSWFYHHAQEVVRNPNPPSEAIGICICDHYFLFPFTPTSIWPIINLYVYAASDADFNKQPHWSIRGKKKQKQIKNHWDLINPTDWCYLLTRCARLHKQVHRFRSMTHHMSAVYEKSCEKKSNFQCENWRISDDDVCLCDGWHGRGLSMFSGLQLGASQNRSCDRPAGLTPCWHTL